MQHEPDTIELVEGRDYTVTRRIEHVTPRPAAKPRLARSSKPRRTKFTVGTRDPLLALLIGAAAYGLECLMRPDDETDTGET